MFSYLIIGQSAVVGDLRVVEVRPTQVRLMWRPPKDQLDVDAYEVRYFVRGGSRNSSQLQLTKKESTTISGLRDRTNYGFEIRTQTASQGKISLSFLLISFYCNIFLTICFEI